ncbi:hypothetical protein FHX46_002644 [Amycolatopsis viridis]|uniref:Uncharacterized protein n=1 Tax=Amycolatopsis viridis TaxID=185678 RepID=A0ABX0SWR8_9PSEU|nr:hypothetical protein [Amycolatopsis viridis]
MAASSGPSRASNTARSMSWMNSLPPSSTITVRPPGR